MLRILKQAGIALTLTAALASVTARDARAAGVPTFKKVFVVILENTDAEEALKQPFLANLAHQGATLNNYHAITHPSQPNYIALTSGNTYVQGSELADLDVKNLADLLEDAGKTWRSYAEDYPGHCFTGATSGSYARKHQPFISYKDIQSIPSRCANIVPASRLEADIAAGNLADFTLYVPDLENDGHNTSVAYADQWLSKTFGPMLKDPRFMKDMLLIVTFDEGGRTGDNQIYISFNGPSVAPGKSSGTRYDTYSLLRTIEEGFGLGSLGQNDAKATAITGIWR